MPQKRTKPKNSKVKVVSNTKESPWSAFLKSRTATTVVVLAFMAVGVSTLAWARAATATYSLWTNAAVPKTITDSDAQGVELGTKFKSQYAGSVTGVRFYKGPQNTGTHTGSLWTNTGARLASVTFSQETAGGWQTATFAKPVEIAANTTYVVSYYAPKGYYSANNDYFTAAYKSGPLTAPRNAGVYRYGSASAFPKQVYQASNYWVDVEFTASRFFPSVKPLPPTNLQGTSLNGGVNLAWTASGSVGVQNYIVLRNNQTIATLAGNVTTYKDTSVTTGVAYSYQVKAVDASGLSSDPSNAVSVTVAAPPTTPQPTPTPPPVTPPNPPSDDPTPVPLPPPSTDWPNASNSGYRNAPEFNTTSNPNGAGKLSTYTGTIQSNTTYRFVDFTDSTYIGSASSHPVNVTFYGCRFQSNSTADANVAVYGDNVSFIYSSFEPKAGNYSTPNTTVAYNKGYQYGIDVRYEGKVTVDHADFWGFGNGIEFGYSSQAKPFTVSNSWFHHARDDGGIDHTDAILENYGGQSYMVIDHNTIVSVGNTNGLALQNGDKRGYSNVKVTNNYFSGFGYTVNAGGYGDNNKNFEFTGNTFGTDIKPVWGPLYSWADGNGNLWRNNKWRVTPGGYSSNTADNGKYWLPGGNLSTTDYTK
jgi:hypothetical protein